MTEPARRYRVLVKESMWRRLAGPVNEADEAAGTEEIDQAWFEMTADERREAERWANAEAQASVPAELPIVDRPLGEKARVLPRISQ